MMSRKEEERNIRHLLLVLALLVTVACTGVYGQRTQVVDGPSSPPERTLICKFTDESGNVRNLPNSVFYLNGVDVSQMLAEGSFTEQIGRIKFQLTQELEGTYTCNNGTSFVQEISLQVVAPPTRNTSIQLYYVRSVGELVTMACGIRQGRLAQFYSVEWFIDQSQNVETEYGDRAVVTREELEDYSISIQPLLLTDNNTYQCQVSVGDQNDPYRLGSKEISLLVFQHPDIQYLSEDQLHVVYSENKTSLSPIQFICNASGAPDLKVYWKHNENILSSGNTFTIDTQTDTSEGLTLAHSILQINRPSLANSGNITCLVSIQYRSEDATSSEPLLRAISRSRSLTVLDSSLEPIPYATQDEDLLLRMDVPNGVTIPGVTQIRLRINPEGESSKSLEMPVDDVFFEGSRFYAFVPASHLQSHRRFHVQVALVVDSQIGPFSPERVTDLQYIDIDEEETFDHIRLAVIGLGLVLLLSMVAIALIITIGFCYKKRSDARVIAMKARLKEIEIEAEHDGRVLIDRQAQRRAWDVLLETARATLKEEKEKNPRDEKMIQDMMSIVREILKTRIVALVDEQKQEKMRKPTRWMRMRTSAAASVAASFLPTQAPDAVEGELRVFSVGEGEANRDRVEHQITGVGNGSAINLAERGTFGDDGGAENPEPLEDDFGDDEETPGNIEMKNTMENDDIDNIIGQIDSVLYKSKI